MTGAAEPTAELVLAGAVLAREGLVQAFGHLSVRVSDSAFVVTPAMPLGGLDAGTPCPTVGLGDSELPPGAPGEAWIHAGIYAARPDVRAVCRAQPLHATVLAATGVPLRALHGHGALVGRRVPLFDDARLVRDRDQGRAVAAAMGGDSALVLRGNGAVTVGTTHLGEAVARMWALEASARVNHAVLAAGAVSPRELSAAEADYWWSLRHEILGRIWGYLTEGHTRHR